MTSSGSTHRASHAGAAPHQLATLGAVVVAAGRGERLGAGAPKAFTRLGGRTLLEYAIETIASLPHEGHLVLVVPEERAAEALELVELALPGDARWEASVVHGGRERHESVRFGLAALPESIDTVVVHDAARPLASAALFERVIAEVHRTGDAVVPGLPIADTVKRVDVSGIVHETVDRSPLVAVQTPQGFPREQLDSAHATAALHAELPTDDAEVVQRAGGRVRIVAGEARAHKLTSPDDLILLEAHLRDADRESLR